MSTESKHKDTTRSLMDRKQMKSDKGMMHITAGKKKNGRRSHSVLRTVCYLKLGFWNFLLDIYVLLLAIQSWY